MTDPEAPASRFEQRVPRPVLAAVLALGIDLVLRSVRMILGGTGAIGIITGAVLLVLFLTGRARPWILVAAGLSVFWAFMAVLPIVRGVEAFDPLTASLTGASALANLLVIWALYQDATLVWLDRAARERETRKDLS